MWGKYVAAGFVALAVAGCGSSAEEPVASSSSPLVWPSMAPPMTSTSTSTAPALNFTDDADALFVTELGRRGVAGVGDDPETMVLAGNGVCLMMVNEGADLIEAATWVMDAYEVSGDDAGVIATTAVDVYCPDSR